MDTPSTSTKAVYRSPAGSSRLHLIDALRAVASQIILWHHLALYGPLSSAAAELVPGLIQGLITYARMTSIFFVVGGFMTAKALTAHLPDTPRKIGAAMLHRWKRLGPTYLVVIALTIVVNAVALQWMSDPMLSANPTPLQLLAHAVYLQEILHYESLSAGIWYVAIDFQLTLLVVLGLALSAFLARRLGRPVLTVAQFVFWPLALASLAFFNLRSGFDPWALYFFGSFFLGMLLQWALGGGLPRAAFWAYLALVIAAGVVAFRPRLLTSAVVAIVIALAARFDVLGDWPRNRVVLWVGRMSYSVFLVHFPVWLAFNAVCVRLDLVTPLVGLVSMPLAWLTSLGAGWLLHRFVESPSARWASGRRVLAAPEPVPREAPEATP